MTHHVASLPVPSIPFPFLSFPFNSRYALSCFGWGLAGAVALKADKLRWIPGQKSARYDIAGFVSIVSDWPIADEAVLRYKENDDDEWKETKMSTINLIVTNLSYLGNDHPIHPEVKPDDGKLVLSYIDSKCSRWRTVRLGMGMKKASDDTKTPHSPPYFDFRSLEKRRVGAPHPCPFFSLVASCLIYADMRTFR